ncbi:MAG: hypothetical protein LQ344_003501 [Seirophora lacunosa]|nr:MAG: hypothetical protein LQ344_003501 [Seirophora lacunosa]
MAKVSENVTHTTHKLESLLTVDNMQRAAIYLQKSTSETARDLIDFAVTRDRKTNDAVMCLLGDLIVLTIMLESEMTHVHDAELFLEGNLDLEEMDPIKSEESSVGTVEDNQDIGLA